MHLDMKTQCEKCGIALAADGDACICSYECTFCAPCASALRDTCPHCGGELTHRPRRTASESSSPLVPSPGLEIRPWMVWIFSLAIFALITFIATATIYKFYRIRGIPMSLGTTIGLETSQILTYVPLAPFVFYLAIGYPLRRHNWGRLMLVYIPAAFTFVLLHVALRGLTFGVWNTAAGTYLSAIRDPVTHAFHIRWDLFETLFFLNVVDDITGTFVPIVVVAHAVNYYRQMRERELFTAQLETQLAKAHLHALKSQLQPHFLFNTLHSISSLMHTDVRAADRMMTRLSDLLRLSLRDDQVQVTTLNREMEFVDGYLEIEKIRFADRLKVVQNIAPNTLDAMVPNLLLQPLVENAIRHGISKRTAGGVISISALHEEGNLCLTIKDNGPGPHNAEDLTSGDGLGLRATRERLQTLYGKQQSLEVRAAESGGLEVQVRLPFRLLERPLLYELDTGDSVSVFHSQ